MKKIHKDEKAYSNKECEILWLKQRIEKLETGKEMPIWQITGAEVNDEDRWHNLHYNYVPYFPNEDFKYRIKPTEYTYYHAVMKEERTNKLYPISRGSKEYITNFIKNKNGYTLIGEIKEETVRCDK